MASPESQYLPLQKGYNFEYGAEEKKKGCCTRKTIIIIVVVAIIILALGLGLGLGLRNSGSGEALQTTTVAPPVTGCKKFQEDAISSRAAPSLGEKWLKKNIDSGTPAKCPSGFSKPPLILISLDGFRSEYLERDITPVMEKLRNIGVNTRYMRPSFPTKTFPNHYSIVTGLYPESHGIIENLMYDMELRQVFTLAGKESKDPRWWHGEPIWLTAQRAGLKAATMFWPGSEVKIDGEYPDRCYQYDKSIPFDDRVNRVFSWLDLPASERPDVITLYFHEPDGAGHQQGPYGDWVTANITAVDGWIGMLLDGLIDRGLDSCVNVMVVSDHGMTPIKCDQQIDLSLPLLDMNLTIFDGVMGRITSKYLINRRDLQVEHNPNPIPPEKIKSRLECENYDDLLDYNAKVYLKGELPIRNHYAISPRIEEIIVTAEDSWLVKNGRASGGACTGGAHGYDNVYNNMRAIFMAFGNSFKKITTEEVENIEIYNLMTDVLGIKPAPNNGTYGRLHHVLTQPPSSPTLPSPGSGYKKSVYPDEQERKDRRAASDCNCTTGITDIEATDERLNLDGAAQTASEEKHLRIGVPIMSQAGLNLWQLTQSGYVSAYSTNHKMALWSAFSLDDQSGNTTEPDECIRVDVRLSTSEIAPCANFTSKNISASYLLPPGLLGDAELDAKISSNIVPMYTAFQKGIWARVLKLITEYRRHYQNINVMMGPVFDDNHDGLSDDVITRFVPGTMVPLPTHYYVILTKCKDKSTVASCKEENIENMAMIIPHMQDPGNCWDAEEERPIEYLQTNVARIRDIELITGTTLYSNVGSIYEQLRLRTHLEIGLWPRVSWMDEPTCDNLDAPMCPEGVSEPPLLVISLDGVRPDYLKRGVSPVLEKLGRCGATSDYMLPIYPSLTFPNHYSTATGLYPESSGIVDNNMYDQHMKLDFRLSSPNKADPRWWAGDPIWNTVQKHNKSSGVMFWPGSDTKIGGMFPTRYFDYDGQVPYSKRVDTIVKWLTGQDTGFRPEFAMLYIEKIDKAGHNGGPDSMEVTDSVEYIDGYLKQLMDGLQRHNMHKCINIVVTSDHGMTDISCEKSVILNDYTPKEWLDEMYVFPGGAGRASNQYKYKYEKVEPENRVPVLKFVAANECENKNMKVYERKSLPKRFHYAFNDRIENITLVMNDEWQVNRYSPWCRILGQHSWDALTYKNLRGIFQAYGPGIKSQVKTEPFENIELYNLFTTLLGIPGADNNGTLGSLNDILSSNPAIPPPELGEVYKEASYPQNDQEYENRVNATGCSCILPPGKALKEDVDHRLNITEARKADLLTLHMPYGQPTTTDTEIHLLHQEDYISAFSPQRGVPLWVAYKAPTQTANINSVNCLRGDVRISLDLQPSCEDYRTSMDYLENHLFPPSLSNSQDTTYDAHIMSNTVPMLSGFATGVWSHLISLIEKWATSSQNQLYVVTGPVYDYNADGKKDEEIDVNITIGASRNISVPSHYFLVLFECPSSGCTANDYTTESYIVEHRRNVTNCLSNDDYIYDHRGRLRDVELLTGLQFFTKTHTVETIKKRLRFAPTFGFNSTTTA